MSRYSGRDADSRGVAQLAADAVALCRDRRRTVLGLTGSPGAGKSTLAAQLCAHVAAGWGADTVALIPMDGFHLADAQLRRLGLLARKGSPETFDAHGYVHLLRRAHDDVDDEIYAPEFDRHLEQPIAGALAIAPTTRLVVTEGNYLLHTGPPWPEVRNLLDATWFVTTPTETRRQRLIGRHVEFGKTPQQARDWVAAVDNPNAELVDATAGAADRVVVNGPDGWSVST